MFTWINKQGVKSSDGYGVQSIDRFSIEYREGSKVVTVAVEPGFFGGGPSVSISPSAFERWNRSPTRNTPEQQAQMLCNFKAAMQFQGVAVEV